MEFQVENNNNLKLDLQAILNTKQQKELMNKIISNGGYYKDESLHSRWSVLYNAYDMVYNLNIRQMHEHYKNTAIRDSKISRVDFIIKSQKMDKLLSIAMKLYRKEFKKYICEYIEF